MGAKACLTREYEQNLFSKGGFWSNLKVLWYSDNDNNVDANTTEVVTITLNIFFKQQHQTPNRLVSKTSTTYEESI